MSLAVKKQSLHKSYLFVFPVFSGLWDLAENRTNLKKLFDLNDLLGQSTTPQIYRLTDLFLISNCSNESDFLNLDNFCIIFDCKNSFKLKKLKSKQKNAYSLANALCSSEDKTLKASFFSLNGFPFHSVQSADIIFLLKPHRLFKDQTNAS